jgi:hypothetical protein
MTQFDPNEDNPQPSVATQLVASLLRHALTAAAGGLTVIGVALTSSQKNELVDVGSAIGLGLVAVLWSAIQKRNAAKR